MVEYIRSHKRRATVFMVAMLCVAGTSVGAFVTMKTFDAGFEAEAASSIAQAQAVLDSGDVVSTGLALIEIIDAYPNTHAKFDAYLMLEELRKLVSSGKVPIETLLEFESKLPDVTSLRTAEARHILHVFTLNKAHLLGKLGRGDLAADLVKSGGDGILETLFSFPDTPWHIGMLPIVFENAAKYTPEYATAYAESLETFISETDPCMATFCARYALFRYYLHEGMDREAAERHIAVMLDAASSKFVTEAVTDPYLYDNEKACFLWARGYAAYETGQNQDALAVFQQIAAELPDSGREKEWAEITIPAVYKKLYPEDPTIAEAAYEDYLTTHEGHEYAQWALLELGNIALETERFDEAVSYFEQVETEYPTGTAASMATSGIEKSVELKTLKSGASPD